MHRQRGRGCPQPADWALIGDEVRLGVAAFGDLGTTNNFGGRREQYIGPKPSSRSSMSGAASSRWSWVTCVRSGPRATARMARSGFLSGTSFTSSLTLLVLIRRVSTWVPGVARSSAKCAGD